MHLNTRVVHPLSTTRDPILSTHFIDGFFFFFWNPTLEIYLAKASQLSYKNAKLALGLRILGPSYDY